MPLPLWLRVRLCAQIDDCVLVGMTPVGRVGLLYDRYNVRAVVNCQDEYRGPVAAYKR